MNFEKLNMNFKLHQRIIEFGFKELTSIQKKCIPEILCGKDVVGQAETGSGKTLAFCLPILDMIDPDKGLQVLILTPTRELCIQVADVFAVQIQHNTLFQTIFVFVELSMLLMRNEARR